MQQLSNVDRVFIAFLEQYNDSTQASYMQDLSQWASYCRQYELDPFNAQSATIENYINFMQIFLDLKPASVYRKFASLKVFYSWLRSKGLTKRDPFLHVKTNASVLVGRIEEQRENRRELLRDTAKATSDQQTKALLYLLSTPGFCVQDAFKAVLEDFYPNDATIRVTDKGEDTFLQLSDEANCALANWLQHRDTHPKVRAIFINYYGDRMTRALIKATVDKAIKKVRQSVVQQD